MIAVTLSKVGITVVLAKLAGSNQERAADLYGRLMSSWGRRPDRKRVTVKISEPDFQLLQGLNLNGMLGQDVVTSGWVVTYRHPNNRELEVTVRSKTRPKKKRTFVIGGKKRRLVAVKVLKLHPPKEARPMAARTKKGKKAVAEDELEDELEGLEELDDDDLEDEEDAEEPEDEDEDEEEEEPAPKRSRKSKTSTTKAKSTKATGRKAKAKPAADEDEDEEDEPAPKRSKTKKSSTKSSAKGNGKGNLPATRELPKGRVGPEEIADMVGGDCDARYVRIFLRDSEDYEREEGSRWSFTKTDARQVAKEIKARRKG